MMKTLTGSAYVLKLQERIAELEKDVQDARNGLRLCIAFASAKGTPWPEVSDKDVDSYIEAVTTGYASRAIKEGKMRQNAQAEIQKSGAERV